jgi:signal transduction histidine kinase
MGEITIRQRQDNGNADVGLGQLTLKIESAYSRQSHVEYQAATGMGFTPEQMDRIFEPFFTTKAQGIGMGLSISRSIIENHSGELRASRRTPRGAKFELMLPTIGVGNAASAS